jgi:hypothetical protein
MEKSDALLAERREWRKQHKKRLSENMFFRESNVERASSVGSTEDAVYR